MDIHHKHGPIGNLREFAKEIGVIVIGVLIALGGEQAVEMVHHRQEVREVRESLRAEMAFNMTNLKTTVDQISCATRRLNEIEQWANSMQTGHPLHLTRLPGVLGFGLFRTAAWRAAPTEALARLPLEERNSYARWYDGVTVDARILQEEQDDWGKIRKLSRFGTLSEAQRVDVADDVDRIRASESNDKRVYDTLWIPLAKQLGVTPLAKLPGNAPKSLMCTPLLAS